MDARSTMGERSRVKPRKRETTQNTMVDSSACPLHAWRRSKTRGSMKKLIISVALAVAALAEPALSMAQSRRVVVVHRPVHHHYYDHHRPYRRPPPRHHPVHRPRHYR
jgi:hypothetical protein